MVARAVLLLSFIGDPVWAQDMVTETYGCDRGAVVQATYLNPDGRSFAVVAFEGRQVGFETAEAASGARYVSADGLFVWWTKGDSAMMLHGSGDAEVMVYAECAVLPG